MELGQPIRARSNWFAPTRVRAGRLHRWLGLAVCAFWLLQSATGLLSVFHWEVEDAALSTRWTPTDLKAIEARLAVLAPRGSSRHVTTVWTTAGLADRYDVTVVDDKGGPTRSVRIAGDGVVLRSRPKGEHSFLDTAVNLHQTLMVGDTGGWIVGLSGMLLFTNLLLGLRAAWPVGGRWRAALWPRKTRSAPARLYGWHRALGLMLIMPAIPLIGAGTARVFEGGLSSLIGAAPPSVAPRPRQSGQGDIGFAAASAAALAVSHARSLTMVAMPKDEDATYRIRVLAPGERRRAYGTTTIFVDAASGAVRGNFPATSQPLPERFMDALYALHTGEIIGFSGRLVVLATGIWLGAMVVLGLLLWRARQRVRRTRANP